MRAVAAGVASVGLIASLQAQVFKAVTELVTVPVAVTQPQADRPISPLTAADFRVFEDGVEQMVTLFDHAPRPVSLCIVLDSSPSMEPDRRMSRTSLADVASTRRQSETLVYAIQTRADIVGRPGVRIPGGVDQEMPSAQVRPMLSAIGPDVAPQIVGDSGGRVFNVQYPTAASNAARALLTELRALHTIGFTPTKAADGRYRRLRVESRIRGLQVRHRGGYLATPKAP